MYLFTRIKQFKHLNLFLVFFVSFFTYLIFFGNFLTSDYYFWGSDAQYEYVPARVYLYEKITQNGTFPFWTERMFLGFPVYADAENGYLNPINLLSILIFGPWLSYKILHLSFYLIGSLSLYLLLRRKEFNLLSFFVANLIFYFNVFMINHQIHFNIILTFYLLPTAVLLAELYIDRPKLKYIILQSIIISFSILYGHIQSSIIFCFGVGLYYVIYSGKKFFNKYTFLYLLFLAIPIFIQTLPQVLPSKELFDVSVRGSKLDMYQGSMYPNMITFLFVPYQFGEKKDFIGKEINTGFTYTEMYMYIGLSTFLVFVFNLLFLKTNKITIYAYLCLWVFLIFFTLAYNKFFDENTPIISSFRHWERTVILFIFGASLAVANLISNLKEINIKRFYLRIFYVLIPFLYLRYFFKSIPDSSSFLKVKELISWGSLTLYKDFDKLYLIFITIFLIFIALFINLHFKNIKWNFYLQIILSIAIFYDLFYFSKDVTNFRLQNISSYKLPEFSESPINERSVQFRHEIFGMEYMYLKSWSPLGYSQFLEKDYKELIKKSGFTELMSMEEYEKLPPIYVLKNFGITNAHILGKNLRNTYETIPYSGLDLIKTKVNAKYLKKEEGSITFETNNQNEEYIEVLLKYNPNWSIKINGISANYTQKSIFLEFKLPSGQNIVEINYIPKPFYLGLQISFALLLLYLVMIFVAIKYHVFKY